MVAEGISPKYEESAEGSLYVAACSSIGLKWPSFAFMSVNRTQGVRIAGEITKAKSGDHTIYLVPTDDGNFTNFIITPPADTQISAGTILKSMEIEKHIDHLCLTSFTRTVNRDLDLVKGE
jgi:hypothetical protein